MNFTNIFPTDLYHSYVIENDTKDIAHELREYLEDRGELNKNSPDVMIGVYDSLGMEDTIIIKEWYKNKPTDGKKKICILGAKFINREAEQSLLKIIEEPTSNTHFFIIVPDSSLLLGTILSRVHVIKNITSDIGTEDKTAETFFKASLLVRIEKVAEIIKKFKDDDNSGGLRYKAISLINGLEKIVYKKWKEDLNNNDLKFILEELKKCRDFLSIPGASVKMVLEHIALVI